MAGKRQHYVPRLLQRGFLAAASDEAERTWLHRRGMDARLVGIGDVGVEEWFYSRQSTDGGPTLDEAITDYERDLSKSVRSLRATAPGTAITAPTAAETVVHLVMRTAHLRSVISTGMTRAFSEIEALFTDPVRLGHMLGLSSPALAAAVTDAIRESAAKLVPAGIPSGFSERLMAFMLRELGDQLVAQTVTSLAPMFPELSGDLAVEVRNAHNNLLAKPLADNGWIAALTNFDWEIRSAENLILPDAVALAREEKGRLTPLLFTRAVDADAVLMPVASDRILIGRRKGTIVDLAEFNEEAAAACEAFFIAARSFDSEGLNVRIGSGPTDLLEAIISESVRKAEQVRSLPKSAIPAARPQEFVHENFSYTVTLADFGDTVLAQEYADILRAVVAELGRDLPLHDLDGITIAADYDTALANLDRGDPELPPVPSGALGYGRGVAKPVTVNRDAKRKQHLVIAAELAATWVSAEASERASGLHALVKMLAGIANATRYASALAASFKPDAMARELHLAVATTPSGYWSAKKAAFVAPDEGGIYADLVIESLAYAEREIAAERTRMTDESDVERTAMRALECVSAVLGHVADWLGHRDGLAEGQAFAGSDLPDQLRSRSLDRWIELFGRDLEACYAADGALEFSVVTTLSHHVERLLWSFGLYCWPEGENVRCIVSGQTFVVPQLG